MAKKTIPRDQYIALRKKYMNLIYVRDKLNQLSKCQDENRLSFMRWDLYPLQNEFRTKILDRIEIGKGKKIYVVFGGNRSGKTELGAGVVAEILEKKKRSRILCATVNYSLSVQVQQGKISKLLRVSETKYGDYNPVRGYKNNIIEMNNGSTAIFRSYEQGRESVQGMDLDVAWLDEECHWDFFQEILARTTDRNGIIIFTFTSLMGFTRLVNFLWESNNAQIETTLLSILDNPFINQDSKDTYLETVDPDEIQSRVYGKPHLKEGLIYKEFRPVHIVEPFDYKALLRGNNSRYSIHEGIDPHERTPHHWVRFLYDRELDHVYVVDELKAPYECMIIRDYALLIKHKRGKVIPDFTQIDTSSMKPDIISSHPDEDRENVHTVRMEFFNCGIETILCTKDNAVGIESVKKRLKVVKNKEGEIKRMPKLYVFNNCKGVIWEFNRYSWDSFSSAKIEERSEMKNKPMKKDDHFMDILKYECIKLKNDLGTEVEQQQDEALYDLMGY